MYYRNFMQEDLASVLFSSITIVPGLHNIADRKIFEVGRKKWRVKLTSLKRKKM
jgi:hypothetical protein